MKISKGTKLLILGAVLVVIDQIIKVLVKTNMGLGETIDVLGDWFKLHFVLNKGMAFGMAFGGLVGKVLLSVFRVVLFAGLPCEVAGNRSRYGSHCRVTVISEPVALSVDADLADIIVVTYLLVSECTI